MVGRRAPDTGTFCSSANLEFIIFPLLTGKELFSDLHFLNKLSEAVKIHGTSFCLPICVALEHSSHYPLDILKPCKEMAIRGVLF